MRIRCVVCGDELDPEHPMCCGNWNDVEPIPEDELRAYERDLAVDQDGHPWEEEE